MISGKAKIAGVIGWPVAHSLSPKMHQFWLNYYGVDGAYIPLPVKPEDLAHVIKALPMMGFRGANVTVPHKETVVPLLDIVDAEATKVGAVNTIIVTPDGKLKGTNTDTYGFTKNVRPHLKAKNKAVILGAGGAARAVCQALLKEGFARIVIVNRTPERAAALLKQFGEKVSAEPWETRARALEATDLLVNATSIGLVGNQAFDLDLSALPTQAVVNDIVYAASFTSLLEKARARGNTIVSGMGMLQHQAVPGFEAWYGIKPQVTDELTRHMLSD